LCCGERGVMSGADIVEGMEQREEKEE